MTFPPRSPLTRPGKPRLPEPEAADSPGGSPAHLANIAMAIDPTYPRRGQHRHSSSCDTSSGTVTTSTSGSPGTLPTPELGDHDEENPAPPYMPIQGQRRTSSLEKRPKRRGKDGGCKQQ